MREEAAATGAGGRVLITPFGQGMENRPEAASSIGQEIFAATGPVLASFEHPFGDEALEPVGQHGAGDVEVDQKIAEAAYAEKYGDGPIPIDPKSRWRSLRTMQ